MILVYLKPNLSWQIRFPFFYTFGLIGVELANEVFSYASSSTPHPCQWVGEWAEFRTSVASMLASLLFFYTWEFWSIWCPTTLLHTLLGLFEAQPGAANIHSLTLWDYLKPNLSWQICLSCLNLFVLLEEKFIFIFTCELMVSGLNFKIYKMKAEYKIDWNSSTNIISSMVILRPFLRKSHVDLAVEAD